MAISFFRLYQSTVDWNTAKTSCEQQDGYIVSINTESENDFVATLSAGPRTWLGVGPDYHQQECKKWLDGTNMLYTNWLAGGQPNNWGGNEGCIEMNYKQVEKWNDATCAREKNYICEKCQAE